MRWFAERARAELKVFPNHHYQFRIDDLIVNYWPVSKRKTAHVRDVSEGIDFTRHDVSPDQVADLVQGIFS